MSKERSPGPIDIEVKDLNKTYTQNGKRLQVIRNLNFSITRGTIVAFIGPSGCGKSTLLRILSKAEDAPANEFWINEDRFRASAYIEQSPALFPWRTALQNAYLGTEIYKSRRIGEKQKVDDGALKKKLLEDFKLFKLKGFEHAYPSELSGGMQQRVAIIRALQSGPRMLFCDEPFSAIDFVTRLYLNTEFKKKSREMQCTTLFVTHNIEEAIFLADRIIVLSRGGCEIVDDFPPTLTPPPEDAVRSRKCPEFWEHFNRIWKKLN